MKLSTWRGSYRNASYCWIQDQVINYWFHKTFFKGLGEFITFSISHIPPATLSMSPQITTYRCAMHPGNELPTLTLMSMVIRILECTPERWMHMLHDLYLSNLSVTPRHAFNSSKKPIRLLCILFFFLDRKKKSI